MVHAANLRAGDRVRVKSGLSVPAWATSGVVVKPHDKPYNSGDWFLHPSVRWEDGVIRPVADSWLERMDGLESAAADVLAALNRWNAEVRRTVDPHARPARPARRSPARD